MSHESFIQNEYFEFYSSLGLDNDLWYFQKNVRTLFGVIYSLHPY
jgi:hypothetical protein